MDIKKQEDNIDLINLVLMLNQNTLISLGEAPRFVGGTKKQNLALARQSINMLKAIQDKSKGNLTPGETKLIFKILGELQAKYVKAAGLDKPGQVKDSHNDTGMEKALNKMSDKQLADLLSELQKKADGKG